MSTPRLSIVALLLFAASCSDSPTKDESFAKAVKAVETAIQPAAAQWAESVASEANRHVHDLGAIDQGRLATGARGKAAPVNDAACAAIKKDRALVNTGQHSLDAKSQLTDFVTRLTAVAFAKYPLVFYDLKTTWPRSWLKEEGRSLDYTAPSQTADPLYLKGILAPRFVADDGSFSVPAVESGEDGATFISWMKQTGNSFGGTVALLIESISTAISECVSAEVQKK